MKRIKCFLTAVYYFLKNGVWVQHVYDDYEILKDKIVIATDSSFRIADSYNHNINEVVYPHADVIKSRCVFCGKETVGWCGDVENIPTVYVTKK